MWQARRLGEREGVAKLEIILQEFLKEGLLDFIASRPSSSSVLHKLGRDHHFLASSGSALMCTLRA